MNLFRSKTILSAKFQLLTLKLVTFCWYAASACLMPYLTIHMKMLGITVEETAIVYTVLPIIQILTSPIAGFIADKLGNYKPVLIISMFGTIITSIAMMMIMPSSGDPMKYQSPDDEARHQMIFFTYFGIRVIFAITNGTVFNMLDSSTLALAEKLKSNFGLIRFWGIVGTGLFSPICGYLVDYLSVDKDEYSVDYSPSFYFFNFFILLTLISSTLLDIEVSEPPLNMLKNVKKLLSSFQIWVLFVVIFILGTLWGFVESFLFLYLLDLHAPKLLLGFTLTTGAIVGLPFLYTSDWFVRKFDYANLMILALGFYFIRFYGYSLIESPYWCFPFEAMEAFTYHLMWIAAATYSAELAPEGLRATVVGCAGSLHYGIGRASGSMIGGTLFAFYSSRLAFRYFGIIAGVSTILYAACHYGFLRGKQSRADQRADSKRKDQESCSNAIQKTRNERAHSVCGEGVSIPQCKLQLEQVIKAEKEGEFEEISLK